jgi:glutamyl/glutaminyl-tRNA synthetase
VVRGDDHISNTPKQMVLYHAVGAPIPEFAHVPLILGADKKRLSKRHGATSVSEYEKQGYLPEAMLNFLALLGWSPGAGDRELFTRDELIAAFDVNGISGGNAVFNVEKLDWFNQQYITRLGPDELADRLKPLFLDAGIWDDAYLGDRRGWFFLVLEQLRPRAKKLEDFVRLGRFFFDDSVEYDQSAVSSRLIVDGIEPCLGALDAAFAELAPFDAASTESSLRSVADRCGVKAATLIHAVRVALTGKTASPGLFEVIVLLGRERTRSRLAAALRLIVSARSSAR